MALNPEFKPHQVGSRVKRMTKIATENLVKRYGTFTAVKGVSLEVEAGEVFGFLGPNGAGKSTTVAMLTTLAAPTEGRAAVGGFDVVKEAAQVRRVSGVALQEIGLDPLMTPNELLVLQASLFGLSRRDAKARAKELLGIVGLPEVANKRCGLFSGGMRRRLDLALALVHEPDILFLDEPTTGLDPASRRDVWREVKRLNRERGMTIFLTTQYLEEADELAERVAIISGGVIVAEGTPDALKAELGAESINLQFADKEAAEHAHIMLRSLADDAVLDQKVLRLYLPNAAASVAKVVTQLNDEGISPQSLTLTQPSLDDVFLQVTGQRFENEAFSKAA